MANRLSEFDPRREKIRRMRQLPGNSAVGIKFLHDPNANTPVNTGVIPLQSKWSGYVQSLMHDAVAYPQTERGQIARDKLQHLRWRQKIGYTPTTNQIASHSLYSNT